MGTRWLTVLGLTSFAFFAVSSVLFGRPSHVGAADSIPPKTIIPSATATPKPTPVPTLTPSRSSTEVDLSLEPGASKDNPKLESVLRDLSKVHRAQGRGAAEQFAFERDTDLHEDIVKVVIEAEYGQVSDAIMTAQSEGALIETTYDHLIQARVPVPALERIANAEPVRFVREPRRWRPLVVTGEGVSLINANLWQGAGVTGTGVKVAIVDAGFAGYTSLLGTELPTEVTARSFRFDGDITGGGVSHGTAVAEVVYEVSPGAQIYLINYGTEVEFANAVAYAITQGAHIISNSTGCSTCGPGDGTGFVNTIVTNAVNSGIFWAQAAGNEARQHWSGPWRDDDSDNWVNFTSTAELNQFSAAVPSGASLWVGLKWNDPFGGSCNDYDLYLYRISLSPPVQVASSENLQTCAQDPVEEINYTPAVAGTYGVAIRLSSGNGAASFHLYSYSNAASVDLTYRVASESLTVPADNPNVLTVGAINWRTPSSIEAFSSLGPTKDGRIKPDIAGPDGVSNATYGTFSGTSASTPHGAGAAALVKQANPNFSPGQIKSFLEGRAVDLGVVGKDNVFGSGRLHLGTAPSPTSTPTVIPTATVTPTPTATPIQTSTPTVVPTGVPTNTPIAIATATGTTTPTITLTNTPTLTATATQTTVPPSGGGGGGGAPAPTPTPTAAPTFGPTPTPTPIPTVTSPINGAAGGIIATSDGQVTANIPPGAFAGTGTVTIEPIQMASAFSVGGIKALIQGLVSLVRGKSARAEGVTLPLAPEGSAFGSSMFNLIVMNPQGVPLVRFEKPVTLGVRYRSADLSKGGDDSVNLKLMRYDGNSQWQDLGAMVDTAGAIIKGDTWGPGLFALVVELPKPTITGPSHGAVIFDLGPLLTWATPPGATQYHIQIIPYNNDGPGVNLIRNAETSYQVKGPEMGVGNYVMLPGMTYTWRVRTTRQSGALGENDVGWSKWVARTFRTVSPWSGSITLVSPGDSAIVGTLTPTLQWDNLNKHIFYYEVQVSNDTTFNTDPSAATAMVYWEIRHGGVTTPPNSYTIPSQYPLEPGTTYYWRVRPRVQGDGVPVSWSNPWSFRTQ